ncbi:MAG: transposase [Bacteroidales bacterium]|nr:transposase [Candidatus Latescibacterota bacterium]
MINIKDHHTGWLIDPWDHLGPKRRKLLDSSWAGVFRKYLFEKLPIERIARHFDESQGRPTKELYTALGMQILQQLHDLSDPDVTMSLAFSEQWHYALDITDNSDASMYVSERSVRRYRKILIKEGLDKVLFETLTDNLIEAFGVDTSKQRLDSTFIQSNMRIMGLVGIFSSTIRKFLKKLRRSHAKLYARLPESRFKGRYLTKDSENLFSQVKPSEASVTLHELGNDLLYLVEFFRSYTTVCKLSEYRLLERVLDECCIVTGSGADIMVELKPPNEIPSDSLQNPSDPDAGYDNHKGSGYQAQIMETFQVEKPDDKKTPDLITHVEVEPANVHDSHALLPAIDATTERGCQPEELVCDSLYGSDDNVQKAAVKEVDVISPVQGKHLNGDFTLADFEIDPATHFVLSCPESHKPEHVYRTRKNKLRAKFAKSICSSCPQRDNCPVRPRAKAFYLRYDDKMLRLAQRRVYVQTTEFKDRYRWRAGVEATMSHLKADVGVAQLRVRGLASVRFVVMLKALGLNILRCAKALDLYLLHVLSRLRGSTLISCRCFNSRYDILLQKIRYSYALAS